MARVATWLPFMAGKSMLSKGGSAKVTLPPAPGASGGAQARLTKLPPGTWFPSDPVQDPMRCYMVNAAGERLDIQPVELDEDGNEIEYED
jgi:hypothetical protein